MIPSKFQDIEVTKGVINGPRPSPLKINKDSHVIHKPSHQRVKENSGQSLAPTTKRQPVIIYTHSPKVIHAQARDFMALVQKLTGLSRADGEKTVKSESSSMKDEDSLSGEKEKNNVGSYGENEIISLMVDQVNQQDSSCAVSPKYKSSNTYMFDATLLNPNSNEFMCSSRPNHHFQSSFMDYMKAFPDY